MGISIDQQVAQLAAEGHQEIAVIKLPSQATRKRRKPSKRRTPQTTNAVASPVDYSPAMSRISPRATNRANAQYKSDRVDFIIRGSAAI